MKLPAKLMAELERFRGNCEGLVTAMITEDTKKQIEEYRQMIVSGAYDLAILFDEWERKMSRGGKGET